MSVKTVASKMLIKPGTSLWTSHPERVELVGLGEYKEEVEEKTAKKK